MDIVAREPHWFALYVKSRHEKAVASSLNGRGYDSFLPTYTNRHKDSKRFELPLFPNYVFCRFQPQTKLPVISTPGVFSIVGNGSQPVSIPDSELDSIKRVLEAGLMPRPWDFLEVGQRIRLKCGPLRGVECVVIDNRHEKWLVLSIPLLRRSIGAKVEREYLGRYGIDTY